MRLKLQNEHPEEQFRLQELHNMILADLLPAARQLSSAEKLKLIQILAEELETAEKIAPLEPCKTYDLPTPYDCFEAGAAMLKVLKQSKASQP
jgi:hypothetical protein